MISIALAAYNGSLYIKEQLDSILNQSIQDFELVICDDCSTDNTWDILQDYKAKDSRISIYRNESNLGFKKNFEKAIGLCHREFIALSDQDDIWTSDHLEILFNIIGNNYVACGNAQIVDWQGVDKGYDLRFLESFDKIYEDNLDLAYRILLNGNPFQGASMLIHKNFLIKSLPIPNGVNFHDAWFSALSCMENKFVYTSSIINKYRQHSDNITSLYKKSFYKSFKNFITQPKDENDRGFYCKALKERLNEEELSTDQLRFLEKICWYYDNLSQNTHKIQLASFRFKHYSKIYSTASKKMFLPRLVKFIFT